MPQTFGRQANWIYRVAVVAIPILILLSIALAEGIDRSQYVTQVNQFVDQPVPFSHQHHVGEIGIDCRYCHTQVDKGAYAQVPPSSTCMHCHSQIWAKADLLAPVRHSYETGEPLQWLRVTKIPDYVYFNHSVHVNKGVACVECHGRMETMPLTRLAHPMQMQFCLNCHRDPNGHLRPPNDVTDVDYHTPEGADLKQFNDELQSHLNVQSKMECETCHR